MLRRFLKPGAIPTQFPNYPAHTSTCDHLNLLLSVVITSSFGRHQREEKNVKALYYLYYLQNFRYKKPLSFQVPEEPAPELQQMEDIFSQIKFSQILMSKSTLDLFVKNRN